MSIHASAAPCDFSDLEGTQVQSRSSETLDYIVYDWYLLRRWYVEEKILNPSLSIEQAKLSFEQKIQSGTPAQKLNDEWCIGVFNGGRSVQRQSNCFESRLERGAAISGPDAAQAFQASSARIHDGRK